MMRSKGGAVLVYTDLSVRSDAVVEAAAELATSNRMDLYVMHALELRNRPLRRDEAIRRCVQHISPSFVLYADGNEIVVRDERRPSEPVPA